MLPNCKLRSDDSEYSRLKNKGQVMILIHGACFQNEI